MYPVNKFRLFNFLTLCFLSVGLLGSNIAQAYDCTPDGSDIANGTSITITLTDAYGDGNAGTGSLTGPNDFNEIIDPDPNDFDNSIDFTFCLYDGSGYNFVWTNDSYPSEFGYQIVRTGNGQVLSSGEDADVDITFDIVSINGCTNQTATNYDENANTDDGSCTCAVGSEGAVEITLFDNYGDGNDGTGIIQNVAGQQVASVPGFSSSSATYTYNLCPDSYAFIFTSDSYTSEYSASISVNGSVSDSGACNGGGSQTCAALTFAADCTGVWGGSASCACAANEYVLGGNCATCPPGTSNEAGDDTSGGDTNCDPTLCAENEYVLDNVCTPCENGTNEAGDVAAGGNTFCTVSCGENEYAAGGECLPCQTGSENAAGDPSNVDSECEPILCAENERVEDNVCVACTEGTNAAGDDATGSNTICDIPGCTNQTATNYNESANSEDGSCTCELGTVGVIQVNYTSDSYPGEFSFDINLEGTTVGTGDCSGASDDDVCPPQTFQLCPNTYTLVLKDSYGDGNDGSGTVTLATDGSVIATLPSITDSSTSVAFGSDCEGTWGGSATCACAENERVLAGNCVACPAGSTNAAGDETSAGDSECDATLCAENESVIDNVCTPCAAGTNAAGDDASGSNTTCDIPGCTNITASNYNEQATVSDDTCTCSDGLSLATIRIEQYDSYGDGNGGVGDVQTSDGTVLAQLPDFDDGDLNSSEVQVCPGSYSVNFVSDSYTSEYSAAVFFGDLEIASSPCNGNLFYACAPLNFGTDCTGTWGGSATCLTCEANQNVVSGACQACPTGTVNEAGDDADGGDTVCDPVLCAENQSVTSNECVSCAAGSTNAAGDDSSGTDTVCDATLCAENQSVEANTCVDCAAGTTRPAGDDATGDNTTCDATLCAANEYVLVNECTACPAGTVNEANDDASGDDTECVPVLCGENQRVDNNVCVDCATGTTNEAGDDSSGDDTQCELDGCAANERVENNACVACAPGTENEAGDFPTGGDTECTDILCAANQRVEDNICVNCPPGQSNEAGDNATETNTECSDILCAANQRVESNTCVDCAPGQENSAGNNAAGGDTECANIECAANQRVESNTCVDCAPGQENSAGDNAAGEDTQCDLVDCGALGGLTNGTVNVGTTTFGSSADFTCDLDYTLIGATSAVCQADGTWSNSVPQCSSETVNCSNNPCLNGGACTDNECTTVATDLFISEYVEGSSNNKALEFFNGTADPIDLNFYSIKIGSNGNDLGGTITLLNDSDSAENASLASGETYLLCNSSADFAAQCDKTTGSISFNGNDAVALLKEDNIIDMIGVVGESNPWTAGDTSGATENNTIVRKASVLSPNATFTAEEWTVLEQNSFDGLGTHYLQCEASGYTCDCAGTGFDGASCETDIDECVAETDNCDDNATCTNTAGAFTCDCNEGYTGDGLACGDVDECAWATDTCDDNASCTNNEGGFDCECNEGFTGTGDVCETVACPANAGPSAEDAGDCLCNTGYVEDSAAPITWSAPSQAWGGTCLNIDECTEGSNNCNDNASCFDTEGGFDCVCNDGFIGDGVTCSDNDECALGTDNCSNDATCTNTAGAFECACNNGFTGDGVLCADVDECADATDACDANATCNNTPGDYGCDCNSGYTGDGYTCNDIDECTDGTDSCDDNATCTNNEGAFECACNEFYTGDGVSCEDLDECLADDDGNNGCGIAVHWTCTNNEGAEPTCEDLDECIADVDGNNGCGAADRWTCTNNEGALPTCEDIDECIEDDAGNNGCGVASAYICTNNEGAAPTCEDIDECTDETDNCSENATCTNADGGFDCVCFDGYVGDGVTCNIDTCEANEHVVSNECVPCADGTGNAAGDNPFGDDTECSACVNVNVVLSDTFGDGCTGAGTINQNNSALTPELGDVPEEDTLTASYCLVPGIDYTFKYDVTDFYYDEFAFDINTDAEGYVITSLQDTSSQGGLFETSYDITFSVASNISGCTNPTALNYNPEATVDDDSCACADDTQEVEIVLTDTPYEDGTNGLGSIILNDENIITLGAVSLGGGVAAVVCAIPETTYTMSYDLSNETYPEEFRYEIRTVDSAVTLISEQPLSGGGNASAYDISFYWVNTIAGCTNPTALNYNPSANVDDDSCICADDRIPVTVNLQSTDEDGLTGAGLISSDGQDLFSLGAITGLGGEVATICAAPGTTYSFDYTVTNARFDYFSYSIDPTIEGYTVLNAAANPGGNSSSLQGGGLNSTYDFDFTVASIVNGCTNPTAVNYDPAANSDDQSCLCENDGALVPITVNIEDSFGDGNTGIASVRNSNGDVIFTTADYQVAACIVIRELGYSEDNDPYPYYWDFYCSGNQNQNNGPYALCPGTYEVTHSLTGDETAENTEEISFNVTKGEDTLVTGSFAELPGSFTIETSVDCAEVINGTAFVDECGTCVGGNTGLEACVQDCNDEWGGTAAIDTCGNCSGGSTGSEPCGWSSECMSSAGNTYYRDGSCDCSCGIDDPDCGEVYTIDDCAYEYCEEGYDLNPDNLTECVPAFDCNNVSGGDAFTDLCGNCVGGDTGLEACGWNPECNFLGDSTYGDGQGCNCGCGVIDSDCPSYGGEDGGAIYYDVADCVESACSGDDYLNPDNPAECLTPVVETDAGSSDGEDTDDAGSSDGAVDGTVTTDAGSGDGAVDGTVTEDAGSSDGAVDGTVTEDAGSSDGAVDGTVTEDAGSSDGAVDGTVAEDAGSSDGAVDGTVIEDAGSSDGASDGTVTADAGTEEPEPETDAGTGITDPCDDYECDEGYVCVVEYGECDGTDAGLLDGGSDEICSEETIYCLEVEASDAGTEEPEPETDAGAEEPEPETDAGAEEEPEPEMDAGSEEVEETDAGVPFTLPDDQDDDDDDIVTPPAQPVSCACSSSEQPASHGKWFLMGLVFLGWRLRRKR